MRLSNRLKNFNQSPLGRLTLFIVGVIIVIISPLIGILPGPGGVFVLAFGLALILRSSLWAKRRYVSLKAWQPRLGRFADWGLRRQSARRRSERAKREMAAE